MLHESTLSTVSLYVKGELLDPDVLTHSLGVRPTRSHKKGEVRYTSTQHKIIARNGLWVLIIKNEDADLSDVVEELGRRLAGVENKLVDIADEYDAFLDIFIAQDAEDEGGGTVEFDLSAKAIKVLSRFGLPTKFTLAVTVP